MLYHVFIQVLQTAQSLRPTASVPFEQSTPGGPVCSCEWKDGDGTVCGELITGASLPRHLSKHRIGGTDCCWKTCYWVGCGATMHRQSIVRHTREVHLGLRRSSKRLQDRYLLQRSVTSSPYQPNRTFSLPVRSVSPKETLIHTCQWTRDDGTICGAQIKGATVPQHLTTHGVKNMFSGSPLPCRWLGCRLRRDKYTMTRKSIVRHVRERHLGCKRPLSINQHYPSYGGYNTDWDQEVS